MTRIDLFAYATTWGLISFITYYSLPVWAQSSRLVNNKIQQPLAPLQFVEQDYSNTDFSGEGRSGDREGGAGRRGNCPVTEFPLTALMPISNWGKTVAEHPTFWFYVPYTPEQAPIGEFVLQEDEGRKDESRKDEDRKDIYRVPFTLPQTPGFVSFSVPPTQNPLEVGKSYRWYFNLYCDRYQSTSPDFVQGWVQREALTPALDEQFKAAKPRQDRIYVDNLIWFDAIAHLANLRLSNSTDTSLNRDWNKLLGAKGVDLKLPSQAPMAGSVTLSSGSDGSSLVSMLNKQLNQYMKIKKCIKE